MIAGFPEELFQGFLAHAQANPGDESTRSHRARRRAAPPRLGVRERSARSSRRFAAFFRDFDVLLTPVNPCRRSRHDHDGTMFSRSIRINGAVADYLEMLKWISPATLCYLPASVAPVGRTREGLPVGMQIVAPYLEDRTAIDFAGRIGEICGGFTPPPGY
jgi:amidase